MHLTMVPHAQCPQIQNSQLCGYIGSSGSNTKRMSTYKAVTRPILEYTSTAWLQQTLQSNKTTNKKHHRTTVCLLYTCIRHKAQLNNKFNIKRTRIRKKTIRIVT